MYCYDLVREDARYHLGFRLPSEAEMEWVLREGGKCAFAFDVSRA